MVNDVEEGVFKYHLECCSLVYPLLGNFVKLLIVDP